MSSTQLVRARRGKIIAGVCAGIAHRYGLSPTRVRLLFIASMLLPGPQIVLYLAGWLLLPKAPR